MAPTMIILIDFSCWKKNPVLVENPIFSHTYLLHRWSLSMATYMDLHYYQQLHSVWIPCDLLNTCLHLASSAPLLFPVLVVWAPVSSPCLTVSHPSSLSSDALSPTVKANVQIEALSPEITAYKNISKQCSRTQERGWSEQEHVSKSVVTHLCLLTGLHSLHEHHVLPASLPLLAEYRHTVSIPFTVWREKSLYVQYTRWPPQDMHYQRGNRL